MGSTTASLLSYRIWSRPSQRSARVLGEETYCHRHVMEAAVRLYCKKSMRDGRYHCGHLQKIHSAPGCHDSIGWGAHLSQRGLSAKASVRKSCLRRRGSGAKRSLGKSCRWRYLKGCCPKRGWHVGMLGFRVLKAEAREECCGRKILREDSVCSGPCPLCWTPKNSSSLQAVVS